MSSGDPGTRRRILLAARELLEKEPGAAVSVGAVAKRAGISRQAVYLHFPDRTSLFVEVSRHSDVAARTADRQRRIDEAPTAREAVREAVRLQTLITPELRGIATALDVLRRTELAAQVAWQEREHARLSRCLEVVARLEAEGDLAPRWDVDTAARLFWAVTSQRVWDDLVVDQGWSDEQYRQHVTTHLEAALLH